MSSCAGRSQSSLLPSMRAQIQHETTPAGVKAKQMHVDRKPALAPHVVSCAGFPYYVGKTMSRPTSIFKGTSIRDMKSKASTPRAHVPGISPSCSGTQSPRHKHLRPHVLGSAEPVERANHLPAHTCVSPVSLTRVCGDPMVRLRGRVAFCQFLA
jgi:hypothetical protein